MENKLAAICIVLLAGLQAILSIAQAEVYRWVDEDGAVHFGDKPAHKQSAEKIEIRKEETANVPDQGNRLKKQQRLLSAMDEERKINKKKQAQEKKGKQEVIANCNYAKKTLDDYLQSGSLFDVDKSGNKVYFSDQQREEEIQKVREAVEYWCKK